ncbi:MAG: CoB--CoM heterodisulfide reductase iron-sulfur subunit A family protein [candidate division WOR-3 bacterium]|nr:MAG: CoB--CoM heterodisulfide reductase iron-sulfur subunit A family protein [candidate division WOR-3 bacterium]
MGQSVLGFKMRGDRRQVSPPFDVESPRCMVCGACFSVCPTASERLKKVSSKSARPLLDEFDQGLRQRSVIHIPFPQAVPNAAIVDQEHCVHFLSDTCKICQDLCEAKAIDFDQKEEVLDLHVGSVILSCGFEVYDGKKRREYGHGRYENVVTSIEFERILSASGPFQGHIQRPGDHREPKKVAFIQCVGSRDDEHTYCSSVCCMHATKEAIIAMEHSPGLECAIFYMDLRAFGKGFDDYYEKARASGVRYIRCRPSSIEEVRESKNLIIKYSDENGKIDAEEFDMVVLSCGLQPVRQIGELAQKVGVRLNERRFFQTDTFTPIESSRIGVFVCGPCTEPKDIPETVTQSSAAAAKTMELLADVRNSLITKREYPPEADVSNQEPRIGVFVCHCGINIGGYVDVPQVIEYVKSLPNVAYVEDNLYTCSQDSQRRIIEMIKEQRLNRVVVASCTPRTHEPLFRETIRDAGLNPYLFEMANIRDQCSWIHMRTPKEATEKAKDLVRMAVAKAAFLHPLKRVAIDVEQKALVIGGGIAGMSASLSLARQGFEVYLVEKENELGGNVRHIYYTIEGDDVQQFLKTLVQRVNENKLIHVYTRADIESVSGFIGNYITDIRLEDGTRKKFKHGVALVATGALEYRPTEYLYGKDPRIITQRELEERLSDHQNIKPSDYETVVMIQCIGSRDDNHLYCSRRCCSQAIKNSLKLLELNPKTKIYVLYRDVRTYGFKEDFYTKAREAGVMFIRYENSKKPFLENNNGTLKVSLFEPVLEANIEIEPNLVVLSTGIAPNRDNELIAKMLKVPLNSDGYFLEAHVKLRPVDFATEGIFVAGLAHSPKFISESIGQAEAAAARAATILANKKYYAEATVSFVNEDLCVGCGLCSNLCPYEAIEIVTEDGKRRSKVNEALCKGCGTCVAACPSGAMDQYGFTKRQIMHMVEVLKE